MIVGLQDKISAAHSNNEMYDAEPTLYSSSEGQETGAVDQASTC